MKKIISFEEQTKRELQREELKQFRHKMAKLKKAKLWKGDARTVKPSKYYKALVRQFSDVISGELQAVFGTPSECVSKEGCKTIKRGGKTYTLINKPKGVVVRQTKTGFKFVDLFESWSVKKPNTGGVELYNAWVQRIAGNDDVTKLPDSIQVELRFLKDTIRQYWSLGKDDNSIAPTEYRLRLPANSPITERYHQLIRELGFNKDKTAYGSTVQA